MNNFKIEKTFIKDLLVIKSKIFRDRRGFFQEIYNKKSFENLGIIEEFVQDNYSYSQKGVLRGLHFQKKNPQTKIIKVTRGKIYDVVVDLREGSKTYGQYFTTILSEENKFMLYIPKSFAHGFLSLEDGTEVLYKCSDLYKPEDESGILWSDKTLNIDWKFEKFGIREEELIISEKDKKLEIFKKVKK